MQGMTLTFKGETYTVRDSRTPYNSIHTKAYMPVMYGLYAEAVDTTANPKEYSGVWADAHNVQTSHIPMNMADLVTVYS